ncbi:efflux RND transporter permease subunit [Spongorhabdus nitratireducens]
MSQDTLKTPDEDTSHGVIAWMVRNRVTPNLLMLVCLIGGLVMSLLIRKEVFPEFDLDYVYVSVSYPGSTPDEIEQGVVLAIENEIRGIEGIKEITSTASEGFGRVVAEVMKGADPDNVLRDIDQAVDTISTFPDEAEKPTVTRSPRKWETMELVLHGDASDLALRQLGEEVKDRLLKHKGLTQVEIDNPLDYEVQVEISRDQLRRYDLSLSTVAATIQNSALELSGGTIRSDSGDIILKVDQKQEWAREFSTIPLLTQKDGSTLFLGDIARVRDGFEEANEYDLYQGQPATYINIYRTGDQTPIGISDAVKEVMPELLAMLPPGVGLDISDDDSVIYQQRMDLLMKNAFLGLLLVLIVLGLFLEFRLAVWVTMGIPVSFLGAMLLLPSVDVSINMVSMFAFIIALGIVVDDAIIAGENIYEHMQQGMSFVDSAIIGAREVAVPLTFSILTNIVAFMPLYSLPGFMGKMFVAIPLVVSSVFVISWIESLLILPTHLAHLKKESSSFWVQQFNRVQRSVDKSLTRFVQGSFRPWLEKVIRHRYLAVSLGLVLLVLVLAFISSGRMGFSLMPRTESDRASVVATLPFGAPLAQKEALREQLEAAAYRVADKHGRDQLLKSVGASIRESEVRVFMELQEPDIRPINTGQVVKLWRQETGDIPGLNGIVYSSTGRGPGGGKALTVELSHRDSQVLEQASAKLATALEDYVGVSDIEDEFSAGKTMMTLKILPAGESLGLTAQNIARQVRDAFYGAQALRQQRGANEFKVMVRLPESERLSEYDLEHLEIRTPDGSYVPLYQVAEVVRGISPATISRREGRRTNDITANVEPRPSTPMVVNALREDVFPVLKAAYPGLEINLQGSQARQAESMSSLMLSGLLALALIYALLAIPFRSYTQPLIVMVVIPFGLVGAVAGHLLMGYSMSIISILGIVALSGVVINDSLILVNYANKQHEAGKSALTAIVDAAVRRFRPIILTTMTTFGGLVPMIFETSRQAKFLIPMAVSLGFGILFATFITLVLLPCLYGILEDMKVLPSYFKEKLSSP